MNSIDLKEAFRFAAPQVREAAVKAAGQLSHLGIRHALAGGLAVGAHGYIRATTHVDFLVGEEAFEHHGTLVAFKPGVPIEIDGRSHRLPDARIARQTVGRSPRPSCSERRHGHRSTSSTHLHEAFCEPTQRLVDVVELVKAGADVKRVRDYLAKHAGDLALSFEELVNEALAE